MLDRLPNEILHKIFSKTTPDSAKTCRLLNRRYDTLITKYGFHKEHLAEFEIHPSFCGRGKESRKTIVIMFNRKKRITFNNFEDMLEALPHYLDKIGRIEKLRLAFVSIEETLMDILIQQKFLRYIRNLDIECCTIEAKDEQKWYSFLEKLNLRQLRINAAKEGTSVALPNTIFNHVYKTLFVNSYVFNVLAEHPWITDSVVRKWLSEKLQHKRMRHLRKFREKLFTFDRIITGMTVHGVIEFINMHMKRKTNKSYIQIYGILNNTTFEQVEQALMAARLLFTVYYAHENTFYPVPVTLYEIISNDGLLVHQFGCLEPEREYEPQPMYIDEEFEE